MAVTVRGNKSDSNLTRRGFNFAVKFRLRIATSDKIGFANMTQPEARIVLLYNPDYN
jgi:hypothetical protein